MTPGIHGDPGAALLEVYFHIVLFLGSTHIVGAGPRAKLHLR